MTVAALIVFGLFVALVSPAVATWLLSRRKGQ